METPSQAIVSTSTVAVTDASGRSITITKLKALDRMRLFEVVGSQNVSNEAYFGYASLAYHVVSIDGDGVPKPKSKLELEALVQRLDDDGFDAIAKGISENFTPKPIDGEALKNA